ncbi:MAG: hypothetical protein CMK09_11900 [Ponticaulis sp.]|nr:hypothetical protein [Ponticaulis sp.]
MTEFIPQNALETDLQAAMADHSKFSAFLKTFIRSEIYVPSVTDVEKDPESFRPVLLDKDGKPLMVVFTSKERAKSVAHVGAYGMPLLGARLVKGMPTGTGLYVNPGEAVGFDMSPEGVAKLAGSFF